MTSANGWPLLPLGDVITHRKQFVRIDDLRNYKRCRVQLHAQGVVLRDQIEGALIKTKTQQVCGADEFLVAEIDAKMGGFGIVPTDLNGAIVSSHYFLFVPDQTRLDPRFLGYYAKTPQFREQVAARGTTNYAAIRPGHVLDYTLPLPPLEEQRRLVAKIDYLASKIDQARKLQSQRIVECGMLVASFTHDLFARQLHRRVDTVALGEIAEIRSGVTLGRDISGAVIELPYLRVANVQDGFLDLNSIKTVAVRHDEAEKWKLQRGDLLLTEGGDWDKLGRGTMWEDQIPNCIHQNHIFRVRLKSSEFDPWYLLTLTGSPYGKAYFQGMSKQTTNLASINQAQLKAFPVYRLPKDEQHRIVSRARSISAKVDGLRKLQHQCDAELDAMLPSILDRAFKGAL